MQRTGKIVIIEGSTDGIGKTTQTKKLKERFTADKVQFVTHHFPTYYSYQGKGVEKYLAGEYGEPKDLSPYFINSLYAYDRAITWRMQLKEHYDKGKLLLLDRYTTSSIIYQTASLPTKAAKIEMMDYIADYEYHKLDIPRPDLVILLSAPIELADQIRQTRTTNEGIAHDVYEKNLELLHCVSDNATLAAEHFHWTTVNCATPDGKHIRTIDDIHQEIYQKIQAIL